MKRLAHILAALAVFFSFGPAFAAVPPIPPPAPVRTGPLSPAVRQVATNSAAPTYRDASQAQFLCKSPAVLADNVSAISITTPNFMIDTTAGFAEVGGGSAVDAASWIEYPKGTFVRMTYTSGAANFGTAANGSYVTSDLTALPYTYPRGANVWIWQRVLGATTGRVLFSAGSNSSFQNGGEGCIFSGVTNTTVPQTGLTFGSSGLSSTTAFRPLAVMGLTTQRSALIIGDSRSAAGLGDTKTLGRPDVGEIGKGLGANQPWPTPYISYGNSGEGLGSLTTLTGGQRANMVTMSGWVSDAIIQLGINDINGGASLATTQTLTATVKGYLNASTQANVWLSTKPPVTTSTDSWATTVNQTTAASNAVRLTFNDWARTSPSGYIGYLEVADACESARNSGLWKATGAAFGWTIDGIHGSTTCYDYIRDNQFIRLGANDNFGLAMNDNEPGRIYAPGWLSRRSAWGH